MTLWTAVFAGGHASYIAAAFASAFALLALELLALRRRARRTWHTQEPGP
jgi:heme exporter protein CcmD